MYVSDMFLFVCAHPPEMHACVCGCGGQEADGSWWVRTPAGTTSTLGQLMFSELTGIFSNTQMPSPPPPSLLPL